MALISAHDLQIAFGGRPLLEDASLQVEPGERIGLVGRNGEGKSTLLKILAGALEPDAGRVTMESGARASLLAQQVPAALSGTAEEVVRSGLAAAEADHRVQRLCSLLEIDGAAAFDALSGGQKRRVLLGRALAAEPDVLLLDEPTNHLDLWGIEWLEGFLARFTGSLLFVTHDRAFLARLATRILDLDRGRLTSWACDYPTYLRRKEELEADEAKGWALLDRTLAREEAWVRQGIKARRTRNEGRVRALERLRAERAARRERVGQVRMTVQQAERSGTRVIEAEDVRFGYRDGEGDGGAPLVRDFSTTVLRGDRIGIIGPNGSGKTTLLHLLLGRLQPQHGAVKHAAGLEVAYFDQHREQLDDADSVADALGGGGDHVVIDGERRHVMGYLQDFLFSPERARQPVGSLSGGERNRLLLARLFTRPANLLVMDEPTNDLDAETVELLEARLLEFGGTVLLVSHDRTFLDNLCTSTLVMEGDGRVGEYVGGYSDWKRTVERQAAEAPPAPRRKPKASPGRPRPERPRKLSYAERRELEALPERIEALEARLAELHTALSGAELYRGEGDAVRQTTLEAETLEREIEAAFQRWTELGEKEQQG